MLRELPVNGIEDLDRRAFTVVEADACEPADTAAFAERLFFITFDTTGATSLSKFFNEKKSSKNKPAYVASSLRSRGPVSLPLRLVLQADVA